MPTPTTGPLSLQDIKDYFNVLDDISLKDLYRGGTLVPDITENSHVPISGSISLMDLYNVYSLGELSTERIIYRGIDSSNFGYKKDVHGNINYQNLKIEDGTWVEIEQFYYNTGTGQLWVGFNPSVSGKILEIYLNGVGEIYTSMRGDSIGMPYGHSLWPGVKPICDSLRDNPETTVDIRLVD